MDFENTFSITLGLAKKKRGQTYVFERKQWQTCTLYISCYAQKRNCKMKRIFNFLSRLFFNIHKKMHYFLSTTNKNSNLVWTICRECNKENVLIFDKIPYIFHAILLFLEAIYLAYLVCACILR